MHALFSVHLSPSSHSLPSAFGTALQAPLTHATCKQASRLGGVGHSASVVQVEPPDDVPASVPPLLDVDTSAVPPLLDVDTSVVPPLLDVETSVVPPLLDVETSVVPPLLDVETSVAPPDEDAPELVSAEPLDAPESPVTASLSFASPAPPLLPDDAELMVGPPAGSEPQAEPANVRTHAITAVVKCDGRWWLCIQSSLPPSRSVRPDRGVVAYQIKPSSFAGPSIRAGV